MKKLFLASSFKDVVTIFADFEKDLYGKTVTFIPTASTVEKVIFYVKAGKKALEKLGLTIDVLEISTASSDEIEEKLKKNDFIYVTGGNTFFLLQELKRTGADRIIMEEVKAGKLYIGESAGAMITAPNIEYAKDMDDIKKATLLQGLEGLGLVEFYTIPHSNNAPFKKAAQKIINEYSSLLKLSPISNDEAILIEGDNVQVKGNKL